MSKSVLLMISSTNFMVLRLTLRSLFHFEGIFVHGIRKSSGSIVLQGSIQLSQYHYWQGYLLSILYSCLLCHTLITHSVWVCFLVLYSISLIYVTVLLPKLSWLLQLHSEFWNQVVSSFVLLLQYWIGYSGSFASSFKL